ncbi:MAG: hypothetical protein OHK0053_03160 [Microscillaceae bacterium]
MPKAGVIFRTIAGSFRASCAFAIGGFVYEEDELAFFSHNEGRWLPLDGSFVPEYQYKDHLGNLRVSFREGRTYPYTANFESTTNNQFAQVSAPVRVSKPAK